MVVDDHLNFLHELANAALQAAHATLANAEGGGQHDVARAFRHAAHEAALQYLRGQQRAVLLLSGNMPPKRFGRGAPRARIILQTAQGGENFALGPPFSLFAHFCIAAAPSAGPLNAATVHTALIRPLAGLPYACVLQAGQAYVLWDDQQQEPLRVSGAKNLDAAMLSVALDGFMPGKTLAEVLGRARGVRAIGSCSAALLAVAQGQVDAHIDIRARLTADHWLAAAAMVRAAGGVVMLLDEALEEANAPINLQQRCGIIAAASRDLLHDILAGLRRAFLP